MVSLNPHHDRLTRPEHLIPEILGPGFTVIGSKFEMHRYRCMQQMAWSIATGEKFLDWFVPRQGKVLFVPLGKGGDFRRMSKEFKHPNLIIEPELPRIGKGCMKKLYGCRNQCQDLVAVFLTRYFNYTIEISDHYKELTSLLKDTHNSSDSLTNTYLIAQWDSSNGRKLWKFSDDTGIPIIVGHEHGSDNKLKGTRALNSADNELSIVKQTGRNVPNNRYILKVVNSRYLASKELLTTYDPEGGIKMEKSTFRELKRAEAREHGRLALTDKDHKILAALREHGPTMTVTEVYRTTGIPRSTVRQRLDGLTDRRKGSRVKIVDYSPLVYLLDPSADEG